MIIQRRKFLTGLASLIAAPALVKASSIMPVKSNTDFLILKPKPRFILEGLQPYQKYLVDFLMNATEVELDMRIRSLTSYPTSYPAFYNEYARFKNEHPSSIS